MPRCDLCGDTGVRNPSARPCVCQTVRCALCGDRMSRAAYRLAGRDPICRACWREHMGDATLAAVTTEER